MSYSTTSRTLMLGLVAVLCAGVIGLLAGHYLTSEPDQTQAIR